MDAGYQEKMAGSALLPRRIDLYATDYCWGLQQWYHVENFLFVTSGTAAIRLLPTRLRL